VDRGGDWGALLRFAAGGAASVLAGFAFFRADAFDPAGRWFQCVTVGALAAGILALVRTGRTGHGAALAAAFALVHVGYSWSQGWTRALSESGWAIVIGAGVLLSCLIFDSLEEHLFRLGKFATLGPLFSGVFLAAAAVRLLSPTWGEDALRAMMHQLLVGLVVGDAAGFGVELVELLPALRRSAPAPERG
jgi:hypothetical protein